MKIKNLSSFIFIILIACFISCNNEDTCRSSKVVNLRASFYRDTLNTKTNKHVIFSFKIDSMTIKGIGVDSILYNNKKALTSIKLPLNYFATESKFSLKFNQITDTITVRYSNIDEYLSLECGYLRTHEIDTILSTSHYIDSIIIINPTVNATKAENIKIYHSR